ncbi:MAG TPA: prephenate/arogenate dehydrogenase family protein, partial [Xanthobacteraceae bacterium]|nr:prephenate/arogenate dehydrogenase family protein [Xanthobacteraceae bacterium]
MPSAPIFRRATILGTGLIGGSFGLALRKYAPEIRVAGWDRQDVLREAAALGAVQDTFSGDLGPALAGADLVYIALPIG